MGIIPTRGASKGIPRKNIRDLAGKPLIVHRSGDEIKIHSLWIFDGKDHLS